MKKTVVQVYSCSYANSGEYSGIGDFLRGTIGMYRLSIENDFDFFVDFSLHPMRFYLKNAKSIHSDFVIKKDGCVNIIKERVDILNYINKSSEDVVVLFGWFGVHIYNTPLTEECSEFIKHIMEPNDLMSSIIKNKTLENVNSKYSVLHCRLGDENFGEKAFKKSYNIKNIKKFINSGTILISDSSGFKSFVKKKLKKKIQILDTKVCHLGHNNSSDVISDTLFEFYLLIGAYKITSLSVYPWKSGFVKAISFVFGKKVNYRICVHF